MVNAFTCKFFIIVLKNKILNFSNANSNEWFSTWLFGTYSNNPSLCNEWYVKSGPNDLLGLLREPYGLKYGSAKVLHLSYLSIYDGMFLESPWGGVVSLSFIYDRGTPNLEYGLPGFPTNRKMMFNDMILAPSLKTGWSSFLDH